MQLRNSPGKSKSGLLPFRRIEGCLQGLSFPRK